MKKLILNEWTFVFSVLSLISVCFLSTGFKSETYADIVVNFFGFMLSISFLIFVIVSDEIQVRMKYVVLGFIFFGMIVGTLSSCSSVPRYGCTNSKYKTGHKPDGYGY